MTKPQLSRAADLIQVETATPPVPFLRRAAELLPAGEPGGGIDAVLEPSAVAPLDRDGRLLLVADDKVNGLVIVDAATGARAQSEPITSRYFPPESAKWEAMARDDAGYFYVIGAHNGQSASEIAARSFLLRFKLTGGGASRAPLAIDENSVTRYRLADALAREKLYDASDPSRNRVKIEGLAVRTMPRSDPASVEIFIGLREPDEPVTVYAGAVAVASPTAGPVPPGAQPLIAPDFFARTGVNVALLKRFSFSAGTRDTVRSQLASLEYVPQWGFFIVTSSEDADNRYHGNTLWFLPGDGRAENNALRAALVYDNDPARTRIPLARWSED